MDLSFRNVEINWLNPSDIAGHDWSQLKVYRSQSENVDYSLIDTTTAKNPNNSLKTIYQDITPTATLNAWYLVTFYDVTGITESTWIPTVFSLVPREKRLIGSIKGTMPPIIQRQATSDFDYRMGLLLALQQFNLQPPRTAYHLSDFPYDYEYFLIWGGYIMTCLVNLLKISIRDFAYSVPGGVNLTIDRGDKINNALTRVMEQYTKILQVAKMNFAGRGAAGLGSVSLPLSLGGMIHSQLLNLYDIFKISL